MSWLQYIKMHYVPRTIFTLDAREYTFLEVMKRHFGLSATEIYHEIQHTFDDLLRVLSEKKISYLDLKWALIPRNDRYEVAFIFDTSQINSAAYGHVVISKLIPLLEKDSINSILCGDYIGIQDNSDLLKSLFFQHISTDKNIYYLHNEQFFIAIYK